MHFAVQVKCRRGISSLLCRTCFMHQIDIPFTLLDMSHTGEGYPYISAGHVSCMRQISYLLRWTCLIQERDILFTPPDMSHATDGYPIYSAGHVSCTRW